MNPILAAFLALAHGPGDPKKPAPGTPMANLKPFITDTLFRLAGGPIQMNLAARGFSPLGSNNEAITMAPIRPMQGDTTIVFFGKPSDHVATHEVGHLIDHRNIIPEVYGAVDAERRPFKGRTPITQDDYFRANRDEYVAEAFARAVESGRKHQFADSTKVDKRMPGAIHLIRWLQTQSPFKKD